jgi:hypothetical protein
MATKKPYTVDQDLMDTLRSAINCKLDSCGCSVREIYEKTVYDDMDTNDDNYWYVMFEDYAKSEIKNGRMNNVFTLIRDIIEDSFC